MKITSPLELPQNTCAYERYDPVTLEPLNPETYTRLQELGWSKEDFSGRTVLDIGCNSGLLTMYAVRLGARRVLACDVQQPFVEFVSRVAEAKNLPVTVADTPLHKLRLEEHAADIVLFMEVLHWAVSQGLKLRDVIRQLSELTQLILYIEFPWSVKEPSIQRQTKLTEEDYAADIVLDELTKYFAEVSVTRFMHYFGFSSGSRRVLIKASQKRPEATILAQLTGVWSLDVALSRGRNQSYLLTSAQGLLVAKLLAAESLLAKLPAALWNELFDDIASHHPSAIVTPEKHNNRYLLPAPDHRHWMLFPFVGQLSFGRTKPFPIDLDLLTDLFIQVRNDFRHVSADLLRTLRQHGLVRNLKSLASPSAAWATDPGELAPMTEDLLVGLSELAVLDDESFDALCHGDLQTGNFVLDADGRPRVVDLDSLCVGTIYADGLIGLMWRGAGAETLRKFCEKLHSEESRPVKRYDVSYAIASGISWYSAVRKIGASLVLPEQIGRLCAGLTGALRFRASL